MSKDYKKKFEKQNYNKLTKHIFLCSESKCTEGSENSWKYLKNRIRKLKLDEKGIHGTRVKCFKICKQGPIAILYPEGIWYHSCTPEILDKIIDQHLIEGKPVEEFIINSKK